MLLIDALSVMDEELDFVDNASILGEWCRTIGIRINWVYSLEGSRRILASATLILLADDIEVGSERNK